MTTEDLLFTRLASSNVLVQAHAAPDSRFMLLPVIERASRITGWTVYDTSTGELVTPPVTPDMAEGYFDGVWQRLYHAREWVITEYYSDTEAS